MEAASSDETSSTVQTSEENTNVDLKPLEAQSAQESPEYQTLVANYLGNGQEASSGDFGGSLKVQCFTCNTTCVRTLQTPKG